MNSIAKTSTDLPIPATGEREAELRALIQATHDKWQIDWNRIYDQHKTASAYKYRPVLGYPSIVEYILAALTPLLDRREGEASNAEDVLIKCHAAELAALRSLVAKKDGAIERVRKTRDKYRKSGSGLHRDNMADHVKAIDELCALTPTSVADELAAKDAEIARLTRDRDDFMEQLDSAIQRQGADTVALTAAQSALREAEAARGEAEQAHQALLPSERVQRLAQEFEQWPASEHQTKCSLLLVALVKELDVYERTRPLTGHERELIDQGWNKIKAADDAARAQETRP